MAWQGEESERAAATDDQGLPRELKNLTVHDNFRQKYFSVDHT